LRSTVPVQPATKRIRIDEGLVQRWNIGASSALHHRVRGAASDIPAGPTAFVVIFDI
jgi:hypothetical protein